jgi:hypothetical protein
MSASEQRDWYIEPVATEEDRQPQFTLSGLSGRTQWNGELLRVGMVERFYDNGSATHLLLRDGTTDRSWDWDHRHVRLLSGKVHPEFCYRWLTHWSPGIAGEGITRQVDAITPTAGVLEVVGVDEADVLHWSEFDGRKPHSPQSRTASVTHPAGFVAACHLVPGMVAAITGGNEVVIFRVSGTTLQRWGNSRKLDSLVRATAIVSRPHDHAIVVIFRDGTGVMLTRP